MVSTASRETDIVGHKLSTIIIVISLLFAPGTAADAEMFSWTDTNNTDHGAGILSKVPAESRVNGPLYLADAPPEPDDDYAKKREKQPGDPTAQSNRSERDGDRQVESLIKALKVSDTSAAAAAELAQIGDERAVDPLIELLYRSNSKWWRGKHAAREALFKIGGTRALKALISVLDDDEIAYYVKSSLIRHNDPQVVDLLASTICNDDENPRIIYESGKVLSEMGERGSEALLSCLQNINCSCNKRNNCSGRGSAAYYLGQMKAIRAVGPLIAMLNEQFADIYLANSVHEAASRALREITGQNLGKDYNAWKRWQADARAATRTINDVDQQSTTH